MQKRCFVPCPCSDRYLDRTGSSEHRGHTGFNTRPETDILLGTTGTMSHQVSNTSAQNLHNSGWNPPAMFNIKLWHRKISHRAPAYIKNSNNISSDISLIIEFKRLNFHERKQGTSPHLAVFCCCSALLRWSRAVYLWQCCLPTGRLIL